MDWLNRLSNILEQQSGAAMAGLAIGCAVLLLLVLYLLGSVVMLRRRYSFLLRQEDTLDLGTVFADVQKQVEKLQGGLDESASHLNQLSSQVDRCVQKIGVVRFDAFEDVGGQQSFAVALLDSKDNGVLVSSLYSRSDCRTYAKSVNAGASEHNLSEEEQQALVMAKAGRAEVREPVR